MTGTACDIFDRNLIENKSNFELFSAWLFGNINTDCQLNEITSCGCSILVPKDKNIPIDSFNLLIMSPEDDKKLYVVITAQRRWIDKEKYSSFDLVGIQFTNIQDGAHEKIAFICSYMQSLNKKNISCSLLKK